MFSHIVSATYLKSWKVPNSSNSIYLFKKNEIADKGKKRNLLNLSGTSFGKKNFYYLKIETCNSKIYDPLFFPIISYLENDYIIKYKDKSITKNNPGLFRIAYLNKKSDLQLIRKKDGIKINIESIKSTINSLWNDTQKRFIENFFSNVLENNWNCFLEKIQDIQPDFVIDEDSKRYIILFITLQFFRDGLQIDKYLSSIIPSFKPTDYQKNNIQNYILIDILYEFILDFNKHNTTSSNIIYNTFLNLISSNWCFNFNINHQRTFLTSDTPVFIDYYNGQEAIIFPLTPSISLSLTKSKRDKVKVKELTKSEIQIINNLIIKNAKEYVVYNNSYISY